MPTATIREVLLAAIDLEFLQTSSSNRFMVVSGERDLALVVPQERELIPIEKLDDQLARHTLGLRVHFSFNLSRAQEAMYGEYRRRNVMGATSAGPIE